MPRGGWKRKINIGRAAVARPAAAAAASAMQAAAHTYGAWHETRATEFVALVV